MRRFASSCCSCLQETLLQQMYKSQEYEAHAKIPKLLAFGILRKLYNMRKEQVQIRDQIFIRG